MHSSHYWNLLICVLYLQFLRQAVDAIKHGGVGCKGFLHANCTCTDVMINCTNTNLQGTEIFMQIQHLRYPNVDTIIMRGNNFTELEANLFGIDVTLPTLQFLDLSNNSIRRIHGRAFLGLTNLKELLLSDNKITLSSPINKKHIPEMPMFEPLQNLRRLYLNGAIDVSLNLTAQILLWRRIFNESKLLHLTTLNMDQNDLTFLPSDFLCNFPELEHLSLSDNMLKDLVPRPECVLGLTDLYLQRNNFRRPSNRFMQFVDRGVHLRNVNITENAFACDCFLRSFLVWLRTADRIASPDQLICVDAVPKKYEEKFLRNIDPEKLKCPDDATGYLHSVYIVIALTMIGLVMLLFCLVYGNRRRLWHQLKHSPVRRVTVGYSRIEKEPEAQPEMV